MSAGVRRGIAHATVAIVTAGRYRVGDREVIIGPDVERAVAGTRLYLPDDRAPAADPVPGIVGVTNETSLAAARRLGEGVACLVFASARHPGGGFLNGAQAQEESLARSSALYACQRAAEPFYTFHREHRELTYSDRVIYSPGVPVFRDDNGDLLPQPYPVTFLTAAAPNRSAIARNQPHLVADIPAALARRSARVLEIAAAHGHRKLVLGAWGCGVFGNDPTLVAETFATVLRNQAAFERVVFAVLDNQRGTPTYSAFARRFS